VLVLVSASSPPVSKRLRRASSKAQKRVTYSYNCLYYIKVSAGYPPALGVGYAKRPECKLSRYNVRDPGCGGDRCLKAEVQTGINERQATTQGGMGQGYIGAK